MRDKITTFIHGLITYDYILFGSILMLFILFIILSILLRRKLGLALFLVIFSFIFLLVAPFIGYIEMHDYLFKNSTSLISQKKLHFTKAVIVKGSVSNESKLNFKQCKIKISAYKTTGNKYKDIIFKLKPFEYMSIVENNIRKGETRKFKVVLEPFTYMYDYNISIKANCI